MAGCNGGKKGGRNALHGDGRPQNRVGEKEKRIKIWFKSGGHRRRDEKGRPPSEKLMDLKLAKEYHSACQSTVQETGRYHSRESPFNSPMPIDEQKALHTGAGRLRHNILFYVKDGGTKTDL